MTHPNSNAQSETRTHKARRPGDFESDSIEGTVVGVPSIEGTAQHQAAPNGTEPATLGATRQSRPMRCLRRLLQWGFSPRETCWRSPAAAGVAVYGADRATTRDWLELVRRGL